MNALAVALISFAIIFGSALLGMLVRRFLPEDHRRDDTKDTVKLGAGLIATLAALVLGLLVGSAKSSFDAVNAAITQAAAKVILLDTMEPSVCSLPATPPSSSCGWRRLRSS